MTGQSQSAFTTARLVPNGKRSITFRLKAALCSTYRIGTDGRTISSLKILDFDRKFRNRDWVRSSKSVNLCWTCTCIALRMLKFKLTRTKRVDVIAIPCPPPIHAVAIRISAAPVLCARYEPTRPVAPAETPRIAPPLTFVRERSIPLFSPAGIARKGLIHSMRLCRKFSPSFKGLARCRTGPFHISLGTTYAQLTIRPSV